MQTMTRAGHPTPRGNYMALADLITFFESSPVVRLLRSGNAPFIIDFLQRRFKDASVITIHHGDLIVSLHEYIEEIQESYPDQLSQKPEAYLNDWRSGENRWLLRFLEAGSNEAVYQLTSYSEQVLSFVDRALNPTGSFIGTESRLQLIVGLLHELTIGASRDSDERLAHLREERQRIQAEIDELEAGGAVTRFTSAKIREQFATALSLLKELQSDFRAVEEQFKEITRQVQQRHAQALQSRGEILGFALDSEDVLKHEDQGVSFYEFVRLILSPNQREKLDRIVAQLIQIEELADQSEGLDTVRRMVPALLAEAEKVMRTNQRLTATLRRLLDERTYRERRRIAQVLNEIQVLMAQKSAEPPRASLGVDIERRLEWSSPLSRGFWSEPNRLAAVDLTEAIPDDDRRQGAFAELARLQRLDWRKMRRRISEALAEQDSITLGELLAGSPPTGGIVEVLGYLQIANEDHHTIDREAIEEVVVPCHADRSMIVSLPLVRFLAPPRVPR